MVIDPVQGRIRSVDEAVRRLLENASARAHFFSRPAAWLRENAQGEAALLEAFADALGHELGTPPGPATRPSWLARSPAGEALVEADPRPAQEIHMAIAAVAAGAAVVSAAAAVVTAVVAVVNTVNAAAATTATPAPPPPVPKPVPK
jgi:hypothetical protein